MKLSCSFWISACRYSGLLFCLLAITTGSLPTAVAQQPTAGGSITGFEQNQPGPVSGSISANGLELSGSDESAVYGNGPGWLFRVGHLTGPAYGRSQSITPFELMPYLLGDNNILFSDFRIFRANDGDLRMGGNIGGGYRQYISEWNRTIGASFFYDRDNLSNVTFEQISVGAESLGEEFDLRGNLYMPVGRRTGLARTDLLADTVRFSGSNILYDQQRTVANTLEGFDAEIAVPVYGDWFQERDFKLAAGGYYFEADGIPDIVGWKGRLQGNIFPALAMQVEITSDNLFETNVTFGVDWSYGGSRKPRRRNGRVDQRYRLTEPVRRNYNVAVANVPVIDAGLVAINPQTGLPYTVLHVSNNPVSVAKNGTLAEPFEFISQAQAASLINPTDIIYVHGGSTYSLPPNNTVNVGTGEIILGEGLGVSNFLPISGFDTLLPVPRVNPNANRPILAGGSGNGVTMADNSTFSGFDIVSPTGHGIAINGVSNINANFNRIFNAGGDGISVVNMTGRATFQNTEIQNANGVGLRVSGGSPNLTFTSITQLAGTGLINNTSDHVLLFENIAGGFVNMTGAQVNDDGGRGILIRDVDGAAITIDNATLLNSTQSGIDIQRGSGVFTFRNTQNTATRIENAADVSLNLGGVGGLVSVSDLSITGRNNIGVNIGQDDSGTRLFTGDARFNGDVLIDTPNSGTEPGIVFDNATGEARFFGDTVINNSGGIGVQVGGTRVANPNPLPGFPGTIPITTGSFAMTGGTTINGASDISLLISDISGNVTFDGINIDSRGAEGIVIRDTMEIFDNNGNPLVDGLGFPQSSLLRFAGFTTVNNSTGTALPGIDIQRTDSTITWGTVNILDTTGAPGVLIANNSDPAFPNLPARSVDFSTLNITSDGGTALEARNNPNLVLGIDEGNITATNGNGVDIEDTGLAVVFNSVTTTDAPFGIRLVRTTNPRDRGFNFAVVGDRTLTLNGTGGLISSSDQAGEFGVFLEDAGSILLQQMFLDANRIHVGSLTTVANPNPAQIVHLNYVQATNSTQTGVDFMDTDEVFINESLFNANGAADFDSILLQAQQVKDYQWTIENSSITDGTGNSIEIGPIVAASADLDLTIENNIITNSRAADEQILILWNGDIDGAINNNILTHTGGGSQVIDIQTNSILAEELAAFQIRNNEITTTAGGDTGLFIDTAGPSDFLIENNIFNLGGGLAVATNRGMDFNLAGNSNTRIISNIVNDNTEGEGFIFTRVSSPATVQIDDNQINILGLFTGDIERGIVFQAVSGQVNLIGTRNNAVNILNGGGPAQFFFMPPGTNIGQILVNGFLVP